MVKVVVYGTIYSVWVYCLLQASGLLKLAFSYTVELRPRFQVCKPSNLGCGSLGLSEVL